MSALAPHIKVLRAEAEALRLQADTFSTVTSEQTTVQMTLLALSNAKMTAADDLQAQQDRALGI